MKKNFTHVVCTMDGEPIQDNGKPVTMGSLIVNALLAIEDIPGAKKVARYTLAQKIHGNPSEAEVTSEDLADIKDLVGRLYGPLAVGQIFALIEE